jgi:molybdopterin/thiamine biosynthesis adenylyltransferase
VAKEDRYSRQMLLAEVGAEGQRRLLKSRALVVGCGALGTHASSFLVRAGVGEVTVVDRDIVDLTNLQRQSLFSERDLGRPKAKVAEQYLREVNSEVTVRGDVRDVNETNIQTMVRDSTVVLDATDNMETRFLVNDACVKLGVPWIYAGAVATTGMTMNIVPGGPCLRCLFKSLPQPGRLPTCDTVGIVNTLPAAVASFEATEAFKIMLGKEPTRGLVVIDVWGTEIQRIEVKKDSDCVCCGKRDFEYLRAAKRKLAVSMCGRNAVQIVPSRRLEGSLEELGTRLSRLGKTTLLDGVLRFEGHDVDLVVFPDGRTIVSGTTDVAKAKAVFSKFIGD